MLPAASLSNVGIYGSGQAFEALLLRMRAHPLPGGPRLRRADAPRAAQGDPELPAPRRRPRRGGRWSNYLATTRQRTADLVDSLFAGETPADAGDSVTLVDWDPDAEDKLLAAICYPHSNLPEHQLLDRVRTPRRRRAAGARCSAYVGDAGEPPPQAGPGLRAGRLPLRRAVRLRRVPRPPAPPPADDRVAAADARTTATCARSSSTRPARPTCSTRRCTARPRSTTPSPTTSPSRPPYAVAMAYRLRYVMQFNAREADPPAGAAFERPGPPGVSAHRPRDAPPDRRAGRPPGRRRGDDPPDHRGAGAGTPRRRAAGRGAPARPDRRGATDPAVASVSQAAPSAPSVILPPLSSGESAMAADDDDDDDARRVRTRGRRGDDRRGRDSRSSPTSTSSTRRRHRGRRRRRRRRGGRGRDRRGRGRRRHRRAPSPTRTTSARRRRRRTRTTTCCRPTTSRPTSIASSRTASSPSTRTRTTRTRTSPTIAASSGDRLQPKRADEQLCPNCFLLVRASAPACPVGDDACPIFS